jgi:hypothetical protein
MAAAINLLASALLLSFILSCVSSGVLQVLAWSRHARQGVVPSLRALWRPDGYLDEVGVRQIRIARSLLIIGVVAYLSYGLLVAVTGAVTRLH